MENINLIRPKKVKLKNHLSLNESWFQDVIAKKIIYWKVIKNQ